MEGQQVRTAQYLQTWPFGGLVMRLLRFKSSRQMDQILEFTGFISHIHFGKCAEKGVKRKTMGKPVACQDLMCCFFSLITKTKSDFCFQKNATFTIISEQQLLFVAQNYFCFFPTSHIWEHRGAFQDGWTCFQIEDLTGPGELLATKKRLYVCEDWVHQ